MKRLLLPFVALVVVLATLTGCGQSGPLFMPDDENAAKEHDKDVFDL